MNVDSWFYLKNQDMFVLALPCPTGTTGPRNRPREYTKVEQKKSAGVVWGCGTQLGSGYWCHVRGLFSAIRLVHGTLGNYGGLLRTASSWRSCTVRRCVQG